MKKQFPSDKQDQFMIRFPNGMRERIKEAAESNNRSMNAEIVSKLERYDSLGGEVEAMQEVAFALATAIDEASKEAPDAGLLVDKINDAFAVVDEHGDFDRAKLRRQFESEAAARLKGALSGAVHIPPELIDRIEAKASKENRSFDGEVLRTLEREYPPPRMDIEVLSRFLESLVRPFSDEPDRPEHDEYLASINDILANTGANWTVQSDPLGAISFYPYATPRPTDDEKSEK